MNAVALPQYTPSDRAPSYAAEPRGGEERLAFAAASATPPGTTRRPSIPTDCLPTNPKGARIVLERWRQEDPSVAPIYRQNEIVRGEVVLDSPADAVSIRVSNCILRCNTGLFTSWSFSLRQSKLFLLS